MEPNTIGEETERRLSVLFADLLAVLNRRADGHYSFVEVVSTTELRQVSRYVVDGAEHEITMGVSLNYGTRRLR